jgi:hypothetical protein
MGLSLEANENFKMVSIAVQAWYRHYELDACEQLSQLLCNAALDHYQDGCRSADGLATWLIETFDGWMATRANAPTSISVH